MPMSPDGLFPAVGMHSLGEEVRLHLNAELGREDDSIMMVDSYEDEWGRLHDVRVCGTVSRRHWVNGLGRTGEASKHSGIHFEVMKGSWGAGKSWVPRNPREAINKGLSSVALGLKGLWIKIED